MYQPSESGTLSPANLHRLSSLCRVPVDEVLICLDNDRHVSEPELLLGAIELGALTGKALRSGFISAQQALSMMDKVGELFEQMDPPSVQIWMTARHDSDCALARDFVDLQRRTGDVFPDRTREVMERFQQAVREKTGNQKFDVLTDAFSSPECVEPIIPFLKKAVEDIIFRGLNWPSTDQ